MDWLQLEINRAKTLQDKLIFWAIVAKRSFSKKGDQYWRDLYIIYSLRRALEFYVTYKDALLEVPEDSEDTCYPLGCTSWEEYFYTCVSNCGGWFPYTGCCCTSTTHQFPYHGVNGKPRVYMSPKEFLDNILTRLREYYWISSLVDAEFIEIRGLKYLDCYSECRNIEETDDSNTTTTTVEEDGACQGSFIDHECAQEPEEGWGTTTTTCEPVSTTTTSFEWQDRVCRGEFIEHACAQEEETTTTTCEPTTTTTSSSTTTTTTTSSSTTTTTTTTIACLLDIDIIIPEQPTTTTTTPEPTTTTTTPEPTTTTTTTPEPTTTTTTTDPCNICSTTTINVYDGGDLNSYEVCLGTTEGCVTFNLTLGSSIIDFSVIFDGNPVISETNATGTVSFYFLKSGSVNSAFITTNVISGTDYSIEVLCPSGECPTTTTTTTQFIPEGFVFEVQTTNINETVTLPLHRTYDDSTVYGDGSLATHNFTVYWDFENNPTDTSSITSYNDAAITHSYSTPGYHVIIIDNTCQTFATRPRYGSSTASISTQITRILRWGNVADFRNLNFYGCTKLTALPHDCGTTIYGISDGTITGAADIKTFAHFLYYCNNYSHLINVNLFSECPDVTTFYYAFASSGVYGDVPANLFANNTLTTSFEGTFHTSSIGFNASNPLPSTLFANNTLVTNFAYTFYTVLYQPAIPAGLFTSNTLATNFTYTFGRSYYSSGPKYWNGVVPTYLFQPCGSNVVIFTGTFSASNITGLDPDYLFGFNPNVEYFNRTFYYCLDLTTGIFQGTLHDSLFWNNTKVKTFAYCFSECRYISDTLPVNLFKYAGISVTGADYNSSFAATFEKCFSIPGDIPEDLFRYNTNAQCFYRTFGCAAGYGSLGIGGTGIIPANLFYYNTKASTFRETFRWQIYLTLAPNGLFRNNFLATSLSFRGTFESCNRLVLEPFIFSEDTLASTQARFAGQSPDFQLCFAIGNAGYSGASPRCAPEIWDDIKYPAVSKVTSNCFQLSTNAAYDNYECIPTAWGGTGYDAVVCAGLVPCAVYS